MILAYNVGTSYLKGAVVSIGGTVVARARVPVRAVESRSDEQDECDADSWLSGIALVTSQLGLRDKDRLRGVVVSSNGPTLVPAGADGEPLDHAMTWRDRRAVEEAELISEHAQSPVDPSFFLPKILWIMRNKPALYERTRWFLPCAEYVSFILSGNPTRVVPSPMFQDSFWNEGAVSSVGIDPDRLAPFVEPGEIVGTVSQRAEDALGIPAGLPVIAGGPDYIMSILGTAATQPGRACSRVGTSEGVNLCWSSPVRDSRLICHPHVARGFFNVAAMISSSGAAMDWAARVLGQHRPDVDSLFREAFAADPGAAGLLFLPFLSPERCSLWDPDLRGSFLGLRLSHGRREMARAVVESTGLAARMVIAAMEANGCQVSDMRVTGARTRSPQWCQMRADITGKRVMLSEQQDPDLVGNACVGFYGIEEFESLSAAAESMAGFQKIYTPNPERREIYDCLFESFSRACARMGEVFRGIPPV